MDLSGLTIFRVKIFISICTNPGTLIENGLSMV